MPTPPVLIVSDSRPVAASLQTVLALAGHKATIGQDNDHKLYSCILIDVDHSDDLTPYLHLDGLESLPPLLFLTSSAASYADLTDHETLPTRHSYLINKYKMLYTRALDAANDDFASRPVFNVSRLPEVLKAVSDPPEPGLTNVFRNVYRILNDSGLGDHIELLSRLNYLDSDLCPDPHEREIRRLAQFHVESPLLEKRQAADLITDNVCYLKANEPHRNVLWIEDQPNRPVPQDGGKLRTAETLQQAIARCFGYYANMSVFLLTRRLEDFFTRLSHQSRLRSEDGAEDRRLFDDVNLKQICGASTDPDAFGLADFQAVVLDLHFEGETQISGKDLIAPLTEAAPEMPIVVFTKSADPEIIDSVLRNGGDFCVSKASPSAVPVFVNRCYDGGQGSELFLEKSHVRQEIVNRRYGVRIRIDGSQELAVKVDPARLDEMGAVSIAKNVEQPEGEPGEFIFKMRNVFKWRDIFLFTDDVEGLGRYVELEGPNKQSVAKALTHFELDGEKRLESSYAELYKELNCPGWLKWLRSFHDTFGELVFGSTSGILTTLGMMIGMYVATGTLSAIIASIVAVAASDSWSDAYSIYAAKLAERGTKGPEAFGFAWRTFLAKVTFPLFFALVLLAVERLFSSLSYGVCTVSLIGLVLLAVMSAERPLVAGGGKRDVANEVVKNILLAVVVLLCSGGAGYLVSLVFET